MSGQVLLLLGGELALETLQTLGVHVTLQVMPQIGLLARFIMAYEAPELNR